MKSSILQCIRLNPQLFSSRHTSQLKAELNTHPKTVSQYTKRRKKHSQKGSRKKWP